MLCVITQPFLYGRVNERLFVDSGTNSVHSMKRQGGKTSEMVGVVIPSAMITYGLISLGDNGIRKIDYRVHHSLEQNNRFWNTQIDTYVQFAPAVAAYTMKLCKIESAHCLFDMTVLYGLSNLLAGGVAYGTKIAAGRERPDKSANNSFPSGHTETAFVAAEFLHQEYKNKSVWISIGGYSAATFVGIARVCNNRHWVSDVVAGAGIGILSTKVVYWVYPYIRKTSGDKPLHTFVFPGWSNGNLSFNLSYVF